MGRPSSYSEEPLNEELLSSADLIIFLDFDGTTRPYSWWGDDHPCGETLSDALDDLERAENVKTALIISSTWKRSRSKNQILTSLPEGLAKRCAGATPDVPEYQNEGGRSLEIKAFFKKRPSTQMWLAVDDEAKLFDTKDMGNLIEVKQSVGFQHEDALKIQEKTASLRDSFQMRKNRP